MAKVKLLVELNITLGDEAEDGEAVIPTEDDLRDAARRAVADALEFVENERGYWHPLLVSADIQVDSVTLAT